MANSEPQVGDLLGRYRLVRMLGRGGMGTVFRARDSALERDVAVKVINPMHAGDDDFRARFRREAVVLSQMDSAHVVSVYDHGEQDGAPYLVTQLIDGGDLLGALRARGRLEPALAIDLVSQVLSGLVDAHAIGVVHRDVKPSNVLLREDGRHAYLCDFGIASSPGAELTRTGVMVGSVAYMAPERHGGDGSGDIGVTADVYSVGCLLWTVLAGSQPYVGTDTETYAFTGTFRADLIVGDELLVELKAARNIEDLYRASPIFIEHDRLALVLERGGLEHHLVAAAGDHRVDQYVRGPAEPLGSHADGRADRPADNDGDQAEVVAGEPRIACEVRKFVGIEHQQAGVLHFGPMLDQCGQ